MLILSRFCSMHFVGSWREWTPSWAYGFDAWVMRERIAPNCMQQRPIKLKRTLHKHFSQVVSLGCFRLGLTDRKRTNFVFATISVTPRQQQHTRKSNRAWQLLL